MKNNKAPGLDGIPKDFFKKFFNSKKVAPLLRIILIKKLLILIVQNVYFYYLIKFKMITSLMNEICPLLFPFLWKEIFQIVIINLIFHSLKILSKIVVPYQQLYLIYLSMIYLINARDMVWLVKGKKFCGCLFTNDIAFFFFFFFFFFF